MQDLQRLQSGMSATEENEWALGCDLCRAGVQPKAWTVLSLPCNLWEQVIIRASMGQLKFCTCRAGTSMRLHCLRLWNKLKEEPGAQQYTDGIVEYMERVENEIRLQAAPDSGVGAR